MPLAGIRALVTRPVAQAEALIAALRAEGAVALGFPLLGITAIDSADVAAVVAIRQAIETLDTDAIAIFISANAVRFAVPLIREIRNEIPEELACCAIGSATLEALRHEGIAASGGSQAMNSEELLGLAPLAAPAGKNVVIFKGAGGREHLAEVLRARGANVAECVVYRRHAPAGDGVSLARLVDGAAINALLLSSAEALDNLFSLLDDVTAGRIKTGITLVVASERIAARARALGVCRVCIAANATDTAMIDAVRHVATRGETADR